MKKRLGLLVLAAIMLSLPMNVNAESIGVSSSMAQETRVSSIPSSAYISTTLKSYAGPRVYVRQIVGDGHYGGYVPYLGSDAFGFHYYGGMAPLIGAKPYYVDVLNNNN